MAAEVGSTIQILLCHKKKDRKYQTYLRKTNRKCLKKKTKILEAIEADKS